jgi:hypothetical protein
MEGIISHIDPLTDPYRKFYEEQKHLDTDALRHLIKPRVHIIARDFPGEEHIYCAKEQLCPQGKYRRPKMVVEAEKRGFATLTDMVEADKKAKEDAKQKEIDELKEMVKALMAKLN